MVKLQYQFQVTMSKLYKDNSLLTVFNIRMFLDVHLVTFHVTSFHNNKGILVFKQMIPTWLKPTPYGLFVGSVVVIVDIRS